MVFGVPHPASADVNAVDSARAEAMCVFTHVAPTVHPCDPTIVKDSVVSGKARPLGAPCLNIDDFPEAAWTTRKSSGRRAIKSSQHKKGKPNALVFRPSTLECLPEGAEVVPHSTPNEIEAEAAWSCASCTFLNAAVLPICEMCDAPREVQSAAKADGVSEPQRVPCVNSVEFPYLSQADEISWDFCDVSSVGSSWLDVHLCQHESADEEGRESSDAASDVSSFVLEGRDCPDVASDVSSLALVDELFVAPRPATSWAALAACNSQHNAQFTTARPVARVPPLTLVPTMNALRKKERKAFEPLAEKEHYNDDELDELDDRRLNPQRRMRCKDGRRGH